jgi:two-component system sensor histidine kinase VicK
MIISGTYIIISIESQEKNKVQDELRQSAAYVADQIISQYDEDEFQEKLTEISAVSSFLRSIRANIINSDGKTIAGSSASKALIDYRNSAVISALEGKDCFLDGKKEFDGNSQVKKWISYAFPVMSTQAGKEDTVEYVVYVQVDSESLDNSIVHTTKTIFIAVILALVLTVFLGSIFANTITSPIALLTKKANMMAKGRLEQRVSVRGNDEIGQLTRSFNIMARELRKTVVEMEDQKNRLEIVLHNMTDGVLAFDDKGKLIHMNKICYEMLKLDNVKITLDWLLEKLNMDKDSIHPDTIAEVTLDEDGKYISVSVIPYSVNNKVSGFIAVLHDITKHRQLDEMRKEFVANVSHEIGTPLTTIKGYAELLLDGALDDPDVAVEFLREINVAADRMKFLRDDLLDLSRFDTRVNKFNKEVVDLAELVSGCVRQSVIVANTKKQTIEFEESKRKMFIFADPGRINQVITNIMSNAMKYSGEGAKIRITLKERKYNYIAEIADNGIGMPPEALGRIFERFYRVDKARSRAMGGNGLGLAIVKEIMDAHSGRIQVYSELGKGTTMVLIFQKYNNDDYIKGNKEK